MIGHQNSGGALVPTHNNSYCQASTLAKSHGLPGSEYHGNSFLVCGCYNYFHGDLAVLSGCILRSELVGRPDRHHFDVCIAAFDTGESTLHPSRELKSGDQKLTSSRTLAFWTAVVSRRIRRESKEVK